MVATIGTNVFLDNSFLSALKVDDMIPKLELLQKQGRVFMFSDKLLAELGGGRRDTLQPWLDAQVEAGKAEKFSVSEITPEEKTRYNPKNKANQDYDIEEPVARVDFTKTKNRRAG